jgi:tetratricopeptide (TPR) repeat protein
VSETRANPGLDSAGRGRRFGRRGVLLCAVLLVAAVGGLGAWYALRPVPTEPPVVDLTDADPAVAEAVQDARAAVLKSRRSGKAWGHFGMVLFAHDLRTEALVALAEAERLDPKEPRWPLLQAVILERGDPERAIPKLRRAAELSADVSVRLHLAEALLGQGDLNAAEDLFRQAEGSPRAELGLAQVARARGDLSDSLKHLARALDGPGAHPKAAHILLAEVYGQMPGQEAKARQERELVARLPDDPAWLDPAVRETYDLRVGVQAAVEHADALRRQGHLAEAAAALRKTVMIYPKSAPAWLSLGAVLLMERNYAGAETALRQAVRWGPKHFEAHFRLGVALYLQRERKSGAVAEAAEEFRTAIRLAPMVYPAYFRLGLCLEEEGDWTGALAAYRAALRFRPDYAEAHRSLGRLLTAIADRVTVAASADRLCGCPPALAAAAALRAEARAHLRNASQAAPLAGR